MPHFKPIIHLPHSSTHFPHQKGFVVSDTIIQQEVLSFTDWYTHELFEHPNSIPVIAPFSRIFCDVERFQDDTQEPMSAHGMGVCYTKSDAGQTIRQLNPQLKQEILDRYYTPHHQKLNQEVQHQLQHHNKALIIDGHSFPDTPHRCNSNQTQPRPDINIGTDTFHTPPALLEAAVQFFESRGYSVGINWPYSGSLVPLAHYQNNKNVMSIMLELNRKLYLQEGTNKKSENFGVVKTLVNTFNTHMHQTAQNLEI